MFTNNCKELEIIFQDNGVARVNLNRADFSNALTWDMEQELGNFFAYCSTAPEVRVIILSGNGKNFCAGGDIKIFKQRIEAHEALPEAGIRYLGTCIRNMKKCEKPIIARINGAAIGAGSALCFASDFRVADKSSKLGAGFISMGFSGDTNGVYTLSQLIGPAKAAEFYMLAKTLGGEDAYKEGLLTVLADEESLDEATDKLALKLINTPTRAIGYQKRMLYYSFYRDLELFNEFEANYMPACSMTDDHAEAVNAFLEKRKPVFTGK